MSFNDRGTSSGGDNNRGGRDGNRVAETATAGVSEVATVVPEMYPAVCSDCGVGDLVPFKPIEGRLVYCRDCLPKHRKF